MFPATEHGSLVSEREGERERELRRRPADLHDMRACAPLCMLSIGTVVKKPSMLR